MRRVNSQKEDVALSQPLHHNSGVISYNYNKQPQFGDQLGAPERPCRSPASSGATLQRGSRCTWLCQEGREAAQGQSSRDPGASSTQLVSIRAGELEEHAELQVARVERRRSPRTRRTQVGRARKAAGPVVIHHFPSPCRTTMSQGLEPDLLHRSAQRLELQPRVHQEHHRPRSQVQPAAEEAAKAQKQHKPDHSSGRVVADRTEGRNIIAVCMEEDQFQLEEFDDGSSEEGVRT